MDSKNYFIPNKLSSLALELETKHFLLSTRLKLEISTAYFHNSPTGLFISEYSYSMEFQSRYVTNFFFFKSSRPVLGTTQPPIQLVSDVLSLGVKHPGCKADQSPQTTVKVKIT
jgi:hypothetical protein